MASVMVLLLRKSWGKRFRGKNARGRGKPRCEGDGQPGRHQGGDKTGATALGAMAGFVAALTLARIGASALPSLLPSPELVPLTPPSFPESHHDH